MRRYAFERNEHGNVVRMLWVPPGAPPALPSRVDAPCGCVTMRLFDRDEIAAMCQQHKWQQWTGRPVQWTGRPVRTGERRTR